LCPHGGREYSEFPLAPLWKREGPAAKRREGEREVLLGSC
jgi:hypothetical protein